MVGAFLWDLCGIAGEYLWAGLSSLIDWMLETNTRKIVLLCLLLATIIATVCFWLLAPRHPGP